MGQVPSSKPSEAPATPSRPTIDPNTSSTAPTRYGDDTGSPKSPLFPSSPLVVTSPASRRNSSLFTSSPPEWSATLVPTYETTAQQAKRQKQEKKEKMERQVKKRKEQIEKDKREYKERKKKEQEEKEATEERIRNETPEEKVEREKEEGEEMKRRSGLEPDAWGNAQPDEKEESDVEPPGKRPKTSGGGMGMGMGKPTGTAKSKGKKPIDDGSADESDPEDPTAKAPRKTVKPKIVQKKGGEKETNFEDTKSNSDSGSEFGDKEVEEIKEALSASDQSEAEESGTDGELKKPAKSPKPSGTTKRNGPRKRLPRAAKKDPIVVNDSEPDEDPDKDDEPPSPTVPKTTSESKPTKRTCQDTRADGEPCRLPPQKDSNYCHVHNPKRKKGGKK